MKPKISTRRDFLTGAAAALGLAALPSRAAPTRQERKRTLRIAHLTDMHVTPPRKGKQDSEAGFTAALRHLSSQPIQPDFILFGGDMIWDALRNSKQGALAQWDIWKRVVAAETTLPWHACIGNHDIWGWTRNDPAIKHDPLYGKGLVIEQLGMPHRYYSMDQGDWHVIVLDSLQLNAALDVGYSAIIDDEQMAWLTADLAAVPTSRPIIVFSHAPIMSGAVFMPGNSVKQGAFVINAASMHMDVKRLKDLFHRYPNVKACISGHVHLIDEVRYLGVRYCCNGAVCGGWWTGPFQEFPPAYALIDLYADGTMENTIVPYETAPV